MNREWKRLLLTTVTKWSLMGPNRRPLKNHLETALGVRVKTCETVKQSDRNQCFVVHRRFLAVEMFAESRSTTTLLVIEHFKEAFEIPRKTKRYACFLEEFVPDVFVGGIGELENFVGRACFEMQACFLHVGLHVPPWRCEHNMIRGWKAYTVSNRR